ncbi:Gfo/Idh/MocA family protein [Paenibacillus thermoaerophilus]|uniref:Gfo/Idh/MocA family protein n=1 Tax=Paenibacillus thermoaerophilus TaxID=1215385 RepID=A0ABW2V8K4_9BACL|nr:Gfo/Idh/MocA family oxidoreductase [Paenibacillus thermoaerophilus]TMV17674.1 Gfo/Idh/MocA family oxidoreductase [Paenibacillus thermoaerophilus]
MNVAIVGCGGLGRVHAECYSRIDGVTVVGVCDMDEGAARTVSAMTGAAVYPTYEEMLERSGCDIVSIALPSHLHASFAIRAAAAGKHIVCEKPIALRTEDAEAMIEACDRHGVRLFVGHVVRFFPEYAKVREQIAGGALGRVGVVHAKRAGSHPGDAREWFADDSRSGGVVVDLMIHDLDYLLWTLGDVRSVYAHRIRRDRLDYASATLVFESGAIANVEAQWGYPGPFHTTMEVAGSQGIVRHDSRTSSPLAIRRTVTGESGGPFVEVPQRPELRSPYELELRHFIDCIRDGSEPIVTARDACRALRLAEAVLESASTGRVVYPGSQAKEETR